MIPHQPVAKVVTLAARSAKYRLQSGSANIQSPQHLDAMVPLSPNPRSRTRPQPAIDHYNAVSTFHDDNICEMSFSMLYTSSMELTTGRKCSELIPAAGSQPADDKGWKWDSMGWHAVHLTTAPLLF